jgi:nucleoside-diphosphate-sugar epimerase
MAALVTGSSGFVGSVLLRRLDNAVGISRKDFDLRDFHKLISFLLRNQVDTIFHLAATSTVIEGHNDPYETIYNNVMSTTSVMEAARITSARVVILGSDKEYGEVRNADESAPLGVNSGIYGASKLSSSLIALAYRREFNVPVTVVRSVNIYGPQDLNLTRIIPKAVYSSLTGKPFTLYKPSGKRAYIYVDDVVDALITVAEKGTQYDVVNVCSEDYLSNEEVVSYIAGLVPLQVKEVPSPYPQIGEQSLICERLKALGWRQKVRFEDGIRLTVPKMFALMREKFNSKPL